MLVIFRNRRFKLELCFSKRDFCLQLIDLFLIEELFIVYVSFESKEYWVLWEQVMFGVQDSDMIKYLMDQLCIIFYRLCKMVFYKENYLCRSWLNFFMLFNLVIKVEYRFVNIMFKQNKIRNGMWLYLYYF